MGAATAAGRLALDTTFHLCCHSTACTAMRGLRRNIIKVCVDVRKPAFAVGVYFVCRLCVCLVGWLFVNFEVPIMGSPECIYDSINELSETLNSVSV